MQSIKLPCSYRTHPYTPGRQDFSFNQNALSPPNRPKSLRNTLDEMLAPEVGTKVHNLPSPKPNKHTHGTQRKPLDPLISALIGISKLLLATPQVIHLGDNLSNNLLDPPELRLNGLQLVGGSNGIPVLGIGANVNVELDVARGDGLGGAGRGEDVFEADVKGRVGVRGEGVAVLAYDVFGTVVVVAHCVADLFGHCQYISFSCPHCSHASIVADSSRCNVHAYPPSVRPPDIRP